MAHTAIPRARRPSRSGRPETRPWVLPALFAKLRATGQTQSVGGAGVKKTSAGTTPTVATPTGAADVKVAGSASNTLAAAPAAETKLADNSLATNTALASNSLTDEIKTALAASHTLAANTAVATNATLSLHPHNSAYPWTLAANSTNSTTTSSALGVNASPANTGIWTPMRDMMLMRNVAFLADIATIAAMPVLFIALTLLWWVLRAVVRTGAAVVGFRRHRGGEGRRGRGRRGGMRERRRDESGEDGDGGRPGGDGNSNGNGSTGNTASDETQKTEGSSSSSAGNTNGSDSNRTNPNPQATGTDSNTDSNEPEAQTSQPSRPQQTQTASRETIQTAQLEHEKTLHSIHARAARPLAARSSARAHDTQNNSNDQRGFIKRLETLHARLLAERESRKRDDHTAALRAKVSELTAENRDLKAAASLAPTDPFHENVARENRRLQSENDKLRAANRGLGLKLVGHEDRAKAHRALEIDYENLQLQHADLCRKARYLEYRNELLEPFAREQPRMSEGVAERMGREWGFVPTTPSVPRGVGQDGGAAGGAGRGG